MIAVGEDEVYQRNKPRPNEFVWLEVDKWDEHYNWADTRIWTNHGFGFWTITTAYTDSDFSPFVVTTLGKATCEK